MGEDGLTPFLAWATLGIGKNAVDFAEFMKMMSKNGTETAREVKETFALFNKSGRCVLTWFLGHVLLLACHSPVPDECMRCLI
jgi:hypothetical protein